ncbi:hypothetical protein BaRGS_00015960 [Batillaria attramentaria]|uniref:Antistasin-like domain-containing protein n=1 Tax=Batillaria attramentaria TaxID=370345 RepID=A0ABD0L198_9CAEN
MTFKLVATLFVAMAMVHICMALPMDTDAGLNEDSKMSLRDTMPLASLAPDVALQKKSAEEIFTLSQAKSLRQLIGICAELCPSTGCPDGQVCRSNGCGHTCQSATGVINPLTSKAESLLIQCDFCFDFEDGGPGCPAGYECVGMCPRSCVKIPSDMLSRARSLRQLAGFCAEMCPAEGCPDGTVCRSNGCGHECLPTLVGKVSTRQLDGACVELCSTGSDLLSAIMACPTGYECRSNGCGHSCQKVNTAFHPVGSNAFSLRQLFGTCVEMCSPSPVGQDILSGIMACPAGYECRSNGCGHTCHKVTTSVDCPMVLCALYCEGGFATGDDGCPICACQKTAQVVA